MADKAKEEDPAQILKKLQDALKPVTTPYAPLALSAAQQAAVDNIRKPKGWDNPNPNMKPSPFGYNNSYTSPAWTNAMKGSGSGIHSDGYIGYSNQFTSALTQPVNPRNNKLQSGGVWSGNIPLRPKTPLLPYEPPVHPRIIN